MISAILAHTPVWVWVLLAALTALGLWQTRPRDLSLTRVMVVPRVMMALSAAGVLSAFGAAPAALLAWGAGVGVALLVVRGLVQVPGARWSPDTATLHVPGNALPLVLILGLFLIKYVVGATLALHPQLGADVPFAAACSLGYGLFSGTFLARAMNLRALAGAPRALQTA